MESRLNIKNYNCVPFLCLFVSLIFGYSVFAQAPKGSGGRPPAKKHKVIQSGTLKLVPNSINLSRPNQVEIKIVGERRNIVSNGIPSHEVGQFPNCGNPHQISEQKYSFRPEVKPRWTGDRQRLRSGQSFGVAINGIPFDPLAAEFFEGIRNSKWRYEALSGAIELGVDQNHAHVQPTGAYHYHGLPWGLLKELAFDPKRHSPLVGWAADGYPIYALVGFINKKNGQQGIQKWKSSYQLKNGERPKSFSDPGGYYDGTFIADYEYVAGSGDLDECNGLKTGTPEFPGGTYAYFLTETWPVIPRCFRGVPSVTFDKSRGGPSFKRSKRPKMDCGPSQGYKRGKKEHEKKGSHQRSREAPPHIKRAAQKLGVGVDELRRALGPPPPDFEGAAKKLGMSVKKLRKIVGRPKR